MTVSRKLVPSFRLWTPAFFTEHCIFSKEQLTNWTKFIKMSEVSLSFQGKPLTMMISELSREKKFGKLVPSLPAFLRTLSVYLFIYWLFWVFIAAHRLSLVAETEGYSSLWYTGFSSWWLLLLQSTGSRGTGFSSCGAQA